jgi:hypothetical protein
MIRAFSFLRRRPGLPLSFIFDPADISYYLFARGGTMHGREASHGEGGSASRCEHWRFTAMRCSTRCV